MAPRSTNIIPIAGAVWLCLLGTSHGTDAPTYEPTRVPTQLPTKSFKPTVSPRPTPVPTTSLEPTQSHQPTLTTLPSFAPSPLPTTECIPWREGCPMWRGLQVGSATPALIQAVAMIVCLVSLIIFFKRCFRFSTCQLPVPPYHYCSLACIQACAGLGMGYASWLNDQERIAKKKKKVGAMQAIGLPCAVPFYGQRSLYKYHESVTVRARFP
jgi:hypothetical protein